MGWWRNTIYINMMYIRYVFPVGMEEVGEVGE